MILNRSSYNIINNWNIFFFIYFTIQFNCHNEDGARPCVDRPYKVWVARASRRHIFNYLYINFNGKELVTGWCRRFHEKWLKMYILKYGNRNCRKFRHKSHIKMILAFKQVDRYSVRIIFETIIIKREVGAVYSLSSLRVKCSTSKNRVKTAYLS